jgi:nucleoside transporter
MGPVTYLRLSMMMFIQFFIWGAWYVTAPRYLGQIGFGGPEFGWTYSVGPIAGMISPFFVGMFADRFFATERVLGVMHLLGAAAMYAAIQMMGGQSPSPQLINALFFCHMLCFFPTLALTNTLALHAMSDAEKQFPLIRVFGTLGWIVAGLSLSWLGWEASKNMFYMAATAQAVMGLYSFTLPHTPPPGAGKQITAREILGVDALVLLKRPSFLAFMASSFLICIPLAFYYQMAERTVAQAGVENTAQKMTFGQMSEVLFMVVMPLFFKRLGVKWMLFVGMLAWVARYVLFAIGAPDHVAWMLIAGIVLHGICYDFFFVTGQIYTDKVAPETIRGQAQGMLVLFTLGLGMLIGAQVAGRVEAAYTPPESEKYKKEAQDLGGEVERLEKALAAASPEEAGALQQELADVSKRRDALALKALQLVDWRMVWAIPAVMAGVVMLIFTLVFKEDASKPVAV